MLTSPKTWDPSSHSWYRWKALTEYKRIEVVLCRERHCSECIPLHNG